MRDSDLRTAQDVGRAIDGPVGAVFPAEGLTIASRIFGIASTMVSAQTNAFAAASSAVMRRFVRSPATLLWDTIGCRRERVYQGRAAGRQEERALKSVSSVCLCTTTVVSAQAGVGSSSSQRFHSCTSVTRRMYRPAWAGAVTRI